MHNVLLLWSVNGLFIAEQVKVLEASTFRIHSKKQIPCGMTFGLFMGILNLKEGNSLWLFCNYLSTKHLLLNHLMTPHFIKGEQGKVDLAVVFVWKIVEIQAL